jgi:hypothetical protein
MIRGSKQVTEFVIKINHHWRCDKVFTDVQKALIYAKNILNMPSGSFMVMTRKEVEEKIRYFIFGNKQFHGDFFKTVQEAIDYAKSIGLTSFGIYTEGSNKISDAVYEEE